MLNAGLRPLVRHTTDIGNLWLWLIVPRNERTDRVAESGFHGRSREKHIGLPAKGESEIESGCESLHQVESSRRLTKQARE
jgi:hypothetical protein